MPHSISSTAVWPIYQTVSHTNFVLGIVRWVHGTTHAPGTPPGGGRARAALPGSQRTARAQLVADPLALSQGADGYGGGRRREYGLFALLDRPAGAPLQRAGTRGDAQSAGHACASAPLAAVRRAPGGAGRGRAGAGARGGVLAGAEGGGLDEPQAGAADQCLPGLGLSGALGWQAPHAAPTPFAGRP